MTAGGFGFSGTERFKIVRRLGEGGMGVVYEAIDSQRDEKVALKTLRWVDADAIYRFKKEFRTLADVVHPNLVSLYELMVDEGEWFFTMELVEGVNFIRYVRPFDQDEVVNTLSEARLPSQSPANRSHEEETAPLPKPTAGDEGRLRSALAQLARGVHTLHRAGKVHRDLKPSNVLVTPSDRVVILDFGLAAEMVTRDATATHEEGLWGTIAYMAPEQGSSTPGPESDWYAVGVMLYQALSGRLPFTGAPLKIMFQKVDADPVRPDEVLPDLPSDLVELCVDLMARNPTDRPAGPDVLWRLGVPEVDVEPARIGPSSRSAGLVGRASQFAELENAFATTASGRAVTVYIHGASGIGKTALVQQFLETMERQARAVALTGRCYLRESIPYKALDGVVDSLSRYLRTLPLRVAEQLMPEDITELTRLFPVLLRVDAVANVPWPPHETHDRVELRRRAFGALRELLTRVCATRSLVIYIDDLQWADDESAHLLHELLAPPEPPPLLLLTTFRSEDLGSQSFLQDLLQRTDGEAFRQLRLDPLSDQDTRQLIRSLFGPELANTSQYVDVIVREGAGNPFLIEEIARYIHTSAAPTAEGASLGKMVEARVQQLPGGARQLLQTVAIAGHPVDAEAAFDAADLTGDERPLVSALLAANLLRGSGSAGRVELFHDRLREMLAAQPNREAIRQTHLRLAEALESRSFDDPEVLFEHYLEGGKPREAAHHARRAAVKASSTLAFDRAAMFYQRALELAPEDHAASELLSGLGDALSNAGRLRDAAHAYTQAAALTDATEALEFHRLAAEQLLTNGQIDQGLEEIKTVLHAAGLRLAKTRRRALLNLLLGRIRLRLRGGFRFTEREPSNIPPDQLARIDACRTVAEGLAHLDYIHAADFQTRHALLSLEAGEADRIATALAIEAAFTTLGGGLRAQRRSQILLQRANTLATRINSPHALALCSLISGTTAFFPGYFERARVHLEEAQQMLLDHGVHVAWELMTARLYHTLSLYYLGEIRELSLRAEELLKDAEQRGNRFAGTMFRTGPVNVTWLAADDARGAREALTDALAEWPEEPFRTPHYLAMAAEARISLFERDGRTAWEGLLKKWPSFRATGLLRIESIRVVMFQLRATCALAAIEDDPSDRDQLLASAERDTRRVERVDREWSRGLAVLLRASIAHAQGHADRAVLLLRDAATKLEQAGLGLYAAAARRRLARLVGGSEGTDLMTSTDDWMEAQRIRNPECMTAMVAPGFAD